MPLSLLWTSSPEQPPGAALGADAMAVEEARKRIHATLDAGEDPLHSQPDSEGNAVLEKLHLRPAAKARHLSRVYPEEKFGDTGTPQGALTPNRPLPGSTGRRHPRLPGCTGMVLPDRPGGRPEKSAYSPLPGPWNRLIVCSRLAEVATLA
eukprot:3419264-Amphidinium_carterae.2